MLRRKKSALDPSSLFGSCSGSQTLKEHEAKVSESSNPESIPPPPTQEEAEIRVWPQRLAHVTS